MTDSQADPDVRDDDSREPAAPAVVLPASAGRPAKRSFSIRGHQTSISLERPFLDALEEIADRQRVPVARLVAAIDEARGTAGLSSAIRVFVLEHFRSTRTGAGD